MSDFSLTFLGTGTSTGVPQLRCHCPTCSSNDARDKRLRTSAMVTVGKHNLLIDCGPDFREQMLRYHNEVSPDGTASDLDALLITHHHYDHVGGSDDLRPYCSLMHPFPIYCQQDVANDLKRRMPYCFSEHPYPGTPRYDIHIIQPYIPFNIAGIEIMPLSVSHFWLDILGFRFADKLAYITDAKSLPEQTINYIRGIDTLVINALRLKEHPSHLSLDEALEIIAEVKPRQTWLTHMSHDMPPHAEATKLLPPGVHFAYDGLKIEID